MVYHEWLSDRVQNIISNFIRQRDVLTDHEVQTNGLFFPGFSFNLFSLLPVARTAHLCVANLPWHCLSSFVASHDELSQCLYPGKAWPWWWRLFDSTSSQVSFSLSAIPLIWRLFLFDWFFRYSDLNSCWARSEFKVIPLFCNAKFYPASVFQDGGRRHRIDRMGCFRSF